MRHGVSGRKFGRKSDARRALLEGLAMSLIEHGQITTTLAKAKDLRSVVEPLITKARSNTVANRRLVATQVKNPIILKRLFDVVAPMFQGVNGGYTRVLKAGYRIGDNAAMALIELTKRA
ncbi:MAG TPA: 50S ribosomal protein L17 [Alphaproteobacteria bacterium]|nr:50S ribosomal protein L17 [Alphaproteobacteria bacterium]